MEVLKRKSGLRYREMIWIDGKQFKSPIFRRKTDCQKWLADQRSKKVETILHGNILKLKEKMPFKEFSERWLLGKKAIGLSRSTIENYESYLLNHIFPFFGDLELKRIEKNDVDKFQAKLNQSHKPKGTNLIMTVLKAIFIEALNEGYILRNPAQGVKKISEDVTCEAYWTKSEIDQFLRGNIANPLYPLFLIALNTGMRKGELAGLKWDRVDFSLNQITVTRTRDKEMLKERTKTKLKRFVPMNQLVRATLLQLFQQRQGSEYIFIREDSSPIEVHHIYRDFAKAQRIAKIANKIRFHDLRHTFASQFMMNNGNVFDLQKILGHTDIKMTMRYAHFSPEHLQKAMQGFELGQLDEPTHILPTTVFRRSENQSEMDVVNG